MKKQFFGTFNLATLALVGGLMVSTLPGCKKDDITGPTVTLNGDSEIDIMLNESYSDPGATATDDVDGEITEVTSDWYDVVDSSMVGEYTVTYTATDAAGNPGTATRTVNVYVHPDNLVGNWLVTTDSCGSGNYSWTTTVTTSSTDDEKILMENFPGLGAGFYVEATVSNTSITIASQVVNTYTVIGNATVAADGKSMAYSYSLTDANNATDNCSGTLELQ
jgi:hypothetical protein